MKSHTFGVITLALLAFAGTTSANTYLNLSPADNVTYAATSGQKMMVTVATSTTPGWNKASNFLGTGERWIWTSTGTENVYLFNTSNNTHEKFVNFADPVGTRYSFAMGCVTGGTLQQKGLSLATPTGTYTNVVVMNFSGQCADGGAIQAWFAPQVGLIKWTDQTKQGVRTWELSSGQIGGQALGAQSALSASANFPKTVFAKADQLTANLIVKNTANQNMGLHFASGQEFEITILDTNNQVINTWGSKVRFLVGAHDVTIASGQSQKFGASMAMQTANGVPLAAGQYKVQIELKPAIVSIGGNSASVGLTRAETTITVQH